MGKNRIEEKVRLLKFEERFITPEYLSWLNNKELMKFSEQRHKNHTKETSKEYFLSFENSENLLYAILDEETDVHVGNINAIVDNANKVADIGIIIGKTGQGYGYMSWKEMIRRLFEEKKMRKVTAGAMLINKPMIKIFQKTGMKYEYTKAKHFAYHNQLIDLVGYYIFNSEANEI